MTTASKTQHIIVGMSGGVDSSIAAYLLKKAGHHVEGVFMKNWEADDTDIYCTAASDMADAEKICEQLNIPFHYVNFSEEYWAGVFAHFLSELKAYRTPNPDVLCNKEIKFKAFLDFAKQRGADAIATGHYVQKIINNNRPYLQKGFDAQKDQSYFLHLLTEEQLQNSHFPIGHLDKQTVRELAKTCGFKNHDKKDSTGICFIGERKFKTFLNDYLPSEPGKIETIDGEIVGKHDGLMFYTIGQRQGLAIGGQKNRAELPWYVIDKDLARNVLIVVQGESHPGLFKKSLIACKVHWINEPPVLPLKLNAKIRYRQQDQRCLVEPYGEGRHQVIFDLPQRAVTKGQSIVFYQDDICLGGGIIEN